MITDFIYLFNYFICMYPFVAVLCTYLEDVGLVQFAIQPFKNSEIWKYIIGNVGI